MKEARLDPSSISAIYYYVHEIIPDRMNTGDIPDLRKTLNLRPGQFADVLGKHPATIEVQIKKSKRLPRNLISLMRGAITDYLVLEVLDQNETPLGLDFSNNIEKDLESRGAK